MDADTDESKRIANLLGSAAVYGVVMALILTAFLLPASYVANRFIYHSTGMRILMMLIAGAGSVLLMLTLCVLGWAGQLRKVNYLGLCPMLNSGGWFWRLFMSPFILVETEQSKVNENFTATLLPVDSQLPRVPEELFAAARGLAMSKTYREWQRGYPAVADMAMKLEQARLIREGSVGSDVPVKEQPAPPALPAPQPQAQPDSPPPADAP